jgi:predicted RNA-binding Zn ribbon-like protein
MTEAPPGRVPLVLDFLNTVDLESGRDALSGPADLATWLRAAGLLAEHWPVDAPDLLLARELREGLRESIRCSGDPADVDPSGAFAQLPVVLDGSFGLGPSPALPPVRAALATLVAAVVEAQTAGAWDRVKICGRDSCRWAFWDSSRNRSGTWCSMRVCGNREKMRRRRTAAPA